ncbi:MBL fold metallo-hydrolase [Streptomyces rubradiris]|uniref:MBL fold metallo-hydrolase n=1 Tax=Streptomyces rubradiris TaxID=285531 RepID=A0ABQ3RQZ4_STRRR|nr:MBL fold metallo-hydrolase [Streptomyces rubradiris]GHH24688.1 MBL fold metallo-hydrolase [Streptomyces rubradiris]GHI58263.1 MBL fold metallo-hydrolase [Streptomyces rubradiris]
MTQPNLSRTGRCRLSAPFEPRTTEIADGVYAYTSAGDGRCPSNAGVITGPDGVTIVDTVAPRARAQDLRAFVDDLGAGPVRVVVNTHHHVDHTLGNAVFPGAAVVAHVLARSEMAESALALARLWPGGERDEVRLVPPSVTFDERLTLYSGDRRVELVYCGPAHTTNDVVAWLPEDRVLFTGDIVLSGVTPCTVTGSVEGTLRAVARLRAFGARTVVCGRGPLRGSDVFDETEAYLRWVQAVAMEGWRRGLTPLQTAEEAAPGPFGHLNAPERLVGNLYRAFAELDGGALGRSLELPRVFEETARFREGAGPACLA